MYQWQELNPAEVAWGGVSLQCARSAHAVQKHCLELLICLVSSDLGCACSKGGRLRCCLGGGIRWWKFLPRASRSWHLCSLCGLEQETCPGRAYQNLLGLRVSLHPGSWSRARNQQSISRTGCDVVNALTLRMPFPSGGIYGLLFSTATELFPRDFQLSHEGVYQRPQRNARCSSTHCTITSSLSSGDH